MLTQFATTQKSKDATVCVNQPVDSMTAQLMLVQRDLAKASDECTDTYKLYRQAATKEKEMSLDAAFRHAAKKVARLILLEKSLLEEQEMRLKLNSALSQESP